MAGLGAERTSTKPHPTSAFHPFCDIGLGKHTENGRYLAVPDRPKPAAWEHQRTHCGYQRKVVVTDRAFSDPAYHGLPPVRLIIVGRGG